MIMLLESLWAVASGSMIASSNCQKGQETLPDISVPFVVVALLSRDVTLSTDPQVVLEPRQCGPSGCPCPSPCKMSGAHPGEEAISVSRPISRTGGVFWKSRREPCSSLTADERIPSWAQITHPRTGRGLAPGWLVANRPPCFGLRSRFSCWDAHQPNVDSWAMEEPKFGGQAWGRPRGKSLLQRCGDSLLAWSNPLFSDFSFISAKISSPDETSTIISNG